MINRVSTGVVVETQYLPCLAFFSAISNHPVVYLECCEHFVKQSFRNRCYINTEHGKDSLIVPLTGKHGKTLITDVRIDHSQKWVNNHWRSISSAYGKSPFFEYYAEDLQRILFKRFDFLYDLNRELLTMCLRWLRYEVEIKETLAYEKNYSGDRFDLRSRINPKDSEYVSKVYGAVSYYQVFGNSFVENLSIIDLVFCCGPKAGSILEASNRAR